MARKTSYLQPVSMGNIDGTDSKNCTSQALSNCLDMPIWEARNLLAKNGRKMHEGCDINVYEKAYEEAGLSFVGFFGNTYTSKCEQYWSVLHRNTLPLKGMTLETFCKVYNRGSYVVCVKGHAVCVKGGKLVDVDLNLGNKSVLSAWKKR